jgi:hypothetical protein
MNVQTSNLTKNVQMLDFKKSALTLNLKLHKENI